MRQILQYLYMYLLREYADKRACRRDEAKLLLNACYKMQNMVYFFPKDYMLLVTLMNSIVLNHKQY